MTKRTYGQYCALARALDLVGERWTLLVVRELLLGPRRFTDLLENLPGMGTTLLSARLKRLEALEVARRRRLPPPAASTVYELTGRGLALGRALLPLVMWGAQWLGPRHPDETFRIEWFLLGLRGVLEGADTEGLRGSCQFHVEGHDFWVRFAEDGPRVGAGTIDAPDAVVRTDMTTLLDLGLGRTSPDQATATIEGDPAVVAAFLRVATESRGAWGV